MAAHPTLREYGRLLGADWVRRMSSGIAVVLTVLSIFFGADLRTFFLCAAALAILSASYRTWVKERHAVIALEKELSCLRDERDPVQRALNRFGEDAKELLIQASRDAHGQIWRDEFANGFGIVTNRREFVDQGDPRSEARWDGALSELLNLDTLKRLSDACFQVTEVGYKVVKRLAQQPGK